MALTDCDKVAGPLRPRSVENAPWQVRAKRAGLSQKELASLIGVAENTVSLQLRGRWKSGIPKYVKTFIMAWERLSQEERDSLRAEAQDLEDKPDAEG